MTTLKTLYLHIGTHKTGTTAIQRLLATRSAAFARGGLFVPRTGRVDEVSGHHNIAWQLNDDARYRPALGTLEGLCEELKASSYPAAIVSSEDFEYLYCDEPTLQGLKSAFEACGYQVEVLAFLREQTEMIGSLYQELLKHGLDMNYDVFTYAVIRHGGFVMHDRWRYCLSYERLVAGFGAVFGGAHVHCRRYERPVQQTFLEILGRPLASEAGLASAAGWVNKALPDVKIQALRRYNAWVSRKGIAESRASLGRRSIIDAELPYRGQEVHALDVASPLGLCGVLRWRRTNRWLLRKKGVRLDPPPPRRLLRNAIRGARARLALRRQWRTVSWLMDSARTAACSR